MKIILKAIATDKISIEFDIYVKKNVFFIMTAGRYNIWYNLFHDSYMKYPREIIKLKEALQDIAYDINILVVDRRYLPMINMETDCELNYRYCIIDMISSIRETYDYNKETKK